MISTAVLLVALGAITVVSAGGQPPDYYGNPDQPEDYYTMLTKVDAIRLFCKLSDTYKINCNTCYCNSGKCRRQSCQDDNQQCVKGTLVKDQNCNPCFCATGYKRGLVCANSPECRPGSGGAPNYGYY